MAEQEQIKVQIIASATEATVQIVEDGVIETVAWFGSMGVSLTGGVRPTMRRTRFSDTSENAMRSSASRAIEQARFIESKIKAPTDAPLGPEEACKQALKFLEDDDAWEDRNRRAELRAALWATVYGRAGASGDQQDTPEATDGAA